jgi:hypothetical protein
MKLNNDSGTYSATIITVIAILNITMLSVFMLGGIVLSVTAPAADTSQSKKA